MNDYPIIDYKNVDKVIIFIEMTNFRSRDTLYFDIIADKNLVHASKNIHSRTNIYFHSVTFHVGTGQIVHHAPLFSTLAFIAIHMAIFCNGVQLY